MAGGRRGGLEMTAQEVREFLTTGRMLVLVTLGPDGLPDPVPMWYVVDDDGTIWMRTGTASQKVANLRRDPRVACLVEDGDHYAVLRGVQLTGRVELVSGPTLVADLVVRLMRKYQGLSAQHAPKVRQGLLARATRQIAMRLRVERVVSWDHRKLAELS